MYLPLNTKISSNLNLRKVSIKIKLNGKEIINRKKMQENVLKVKFRLRKYNIYLVCSESPIKYYVSSLQNSKLIHKSAMLGNIIQNI